MGVDKAPIFLKIINRSEAEMQQKKNSWIIVAERWPGEYLQKENLNIFYNKKCKISKFILEKFIKQQFTI